METVEPDPFGWIGLSQSDRQALDEAAAALAVEPAEIVRAMAAGVIAFDTELVFRRLRGVGHWLLHQPGQPDVEETRADWFESIGLDRGRAALFEQIVAQMLRPPAVVLERMLAHALEHGRYLYRAGSADRTPTDKALQVFAYYGLQSLPLAIAPSMRLWPLGRTFPLSAELAKAALLGFAVRWEGTVEDLDHLGGRWELDHVGRAILLHRS